MKRINSTIRLSSDPIKWKKHLVLVDWQLREMENLTNTINRYLINDYAQCLKDIKTELNAVGEGYSFIIKLVYKESHFKLPNIVISSTDDLDNAKSLLASIDFSNFEEIWYCKNKTQSKETVFGRMLFDNSLLFPTRCAIHYEMVWGASARKIEQFPAINTPFISFDRENWNAVPKVDKIHGGGMNTDEMISKSMGIITEVSKYTAEIVDFASFAFACGCNHLCLEFSYIDKSLNFIDWDSDDDMKVLRTCKQ